MNQWSQNHKQPLRLVSLCQEYWVKYMHHVVWRKLDPPKKYHRDCLYDEAWFQEATRIQTRLPDHQEPTSIGLFRCYLEDIRSFLEENLIRQLRWDLSQFCGDFIHKHHLKYGDILLYLIFQDKDSTCLQLISRHIVCRRWKPRERNCLVRTLCHAHKLVQVSLPGQVNDSLLFVISMNCHSLEELNISNSYVTEKGLLTLAGVVVKYNSVKAMKELDKTDHKILKLNDDKKRKRRYNGFKHNSANSLMLKMKPFLEKRLEISRSNSMGWISEGSLYRFKENFGCLRLKKLDIDGTNFPKSGMSQSHVGVTNHSVLVLLILLQHLMEINWSEMGDVIQSYQKVVEEFLCKDPKTMEKLRESCTESELMDKIALKLIYFVDINTNLDNLISAVEYCPNISKIDLWGYDSSSTEKKYWLNIIFSLKHLKDFQAQFMVDSQLFNSKLR